MGMIWERLELSKDQWFQLARAFYDLAHGDSKKFSVLSSDIVDHPVARLCHRYMESGNRDLLDEAGRILTGSRQWYVYLGRTF